MTSHITVRLTSPRDSKWIKVIMDEFWGGEPLVVRGIKYYPTDLEGLVAEEGEKIMGVLSYRIQGAMCEIIFLEAFEKFRGVGTLMLERLKEIARSHQCSRIYLMTTNDNLDALRFYQKRGFTICGIHLDAVKISRALKPSIGLIGDHGILVRDEIDLEFIVL